MHDNPTTGQQSIPRTDSSMKICHFPSFPPSFPAPLSFPRRQTGRERKRERTGGWEVGRHAGRPRTLSELVRGADELLDELLIVERGQAVAIGAQNCH